MTTTDHSNPLPTRLLPARQETLASFVLRCADVNDVPVSLLLKGCQGLTTADLTSRKKLPLSELAHRLSVSEDGLDAMSSRHRQRSPRPRLVGLLQGRRWVCPECEVQGIRSHCEKTWLRFACEEHGVFLQVNHSGPQRTVVASDRVLALQARANNLLRDDLEAFHIAGRLLSQMKQLRRLSKAVRPHEVQSGTQHVLTWLGKVQITTGQAVLTPQRAAILLNCLLPIVSCRRFDSAMATSLRVLCERPANQTEPRRDLEAARLQALEEISNLMRVGKRIAELVDVGGLHEDAVPTSYLAAGDPNWHTLHSENSRVRQGAVAMWNARRQACNDVHEAVTTYRNGPGSQVQATASAGHRASARIDSIDASPITPSGFAADLTAILANPPTPVLTAGRIGLPGPAVRWLMPEIGANPETREVLEHWLWMQSPEQQPRLSSDRAVPLEDIWRVDAQLTVEQKLQLLELRDSVIAEVEGRDLQRRRGEQVLRRIQDHVG
ncbi:hypothetical protein G6020_00140 [Dietzia sp. B19]|nr:hypothetical protein [Dietzia sp. B19]